MISEIQKLKIEIDLLNNIINNFDTRGAFISIYDIDQLRKQKIKELNILDEFMLNNITCEIVRSKPIFFDKTKVSDRKI